MRIDNKFEGAVCALMTPFKQDGSIDVEAMKRHVSSLSKSGLQGFYPCGTSGEAPKLTHDERRAVTRAVVEAAGGIPVFAGGGGTTTDDSLRSVQDAKEIGADGVVLLPPYYYHPTQEALRQHYSTVASKCQLPMFLYNVPNFAGYSISNETVVDLVKSHPNIIGIKDSSGDMLTLGNLIMELDGQAGVFQGLEPLILPSLALGARGAAVSDANVAPGLVVGIIRAFRQGDLEGARKAQAELTRLDNSLGFGDFITATKEALRLMGRPVGTTRKPSPTLTKEQSETIRKTLAELKLL